MSPACAWTEQHCNLAAYDTGDERNVDASKPTTDVCAAIPATDVLLVRTAAVLAPAAGSPSPSADQLFGRNCAYIGATMTQNVTVCKDEHSDLSLRLSDTPRPKSILIGRLLFISFLLCIPLFFVSLRLVRTLDLFLRDPHSIESPKAGLVYSILTHIYRVLKKH